MITVETDFYIDMDAPEEIAEVQIIKTEKARQQATDYTMYRLKKLGYDLTPLQPWSKVPILKDWQSKTLNSVGLNMYFKPQEDVSNLDYPNLGLKCNGMIVIDIDLINDEENPFYQEHHDWFVTCPMSQTGSGGIQCFFKHPDTIAPLNNSAGTVAPGVDVRTFGGQVVIFPSRYNSPDKHPDKFASVYQWVRPMPAFDELPEPPEALLKLLQTKSKTTTNGKISNELTISCSGKPNRTLGKKLTEWVNEHENSDNKPATCGVVFGWLIKAFGCTVKHSSVSATFLNNDFVRAWLKRNSHQQRCWESTVQRAYNAFVDNNDIWELEKPRNRTVSLPGEISVPDDYLNHVENFEKKLNVSLNPLVYKEAYHLNQLEGKHIYSLPCGNGKSVSTLAYTTYKQDERFLIVKERKLDIEVMIGDYRLLEEDAGCLVGYDEDSCISPASRWVMYDKKKSPCINCENQTNCRFGNSFVTELRTKQTDKRILIVTHKMFMGMVTRGEVEPDRRVIIDEELRQFEDFIVNDKLKVNINKVFPLGTPANKRIYDHINHLEKVTSDGSCVIDTFNVFNYKNYEVMENYADVLRKSLFTKLKKELAADSELVPAIEDVLGWLNFVCYGGLRAVMKSNRGLALRCSIKRMELENPVLILDGSALISRTHWKEFTICESNIPLPEYSNTVVHCLPYQPTKNKLEEKLSDLAEHFIKYVKSNPNTLAWLAKNKDFPEVDKLLDKLSAHFSVTLTRGRIVGSNLARLCNNALIACSVFTDLSDYCLGACLLLESDIPATEIYNKQGSPRMNRWGFINESLQHEFMRSYVSELYQTILRGVVRTDPAAEYNVYTFVPSELAVAELLRYLPGAKFVDITGAKPYEVLSKAARKDVEFDDVLKLFEGDTKEVDKIRQTKQILQILKK